MRENSFHLWVPLLLNSIIWFNLVKENKSVRENSFHIWVPLLLNSILWFDLVKENKSIHVSIYAAYGNVLPTITSHPLLFMFRPQSTQQRCLSRTNWKSLSILKQLCKFKMQIYSSRRFSQFFFLFFLCANNKCNRGLN